MPYIGHIVYPIRITSKEYPQEMADALFCFAAMPEFNH